MRNKTKIGKCAFTLVELIVVITILAILGTIAFISLQGYSQKAKNSKVINDVKTLDTAVETSLIAGTLGIADLTTGDDLSAPNLNGLAASSNFANGMTLTAGTNYKVGDVNFIGLRQNGTDFKDNDENEYIAASAIGDGKNVFYQIVGQTTNADGTFAAVVKGNYVQVDPINDAKGLVTPTGSVNGIDSSDINMTTLY